MESNLVSCMTSGASNRPFAEKVAYIG